MFRNHAILRIVLKRGSYRRSELPDVQAGDGAADDHALDLGGALEDREVVGRGCLRPGIVFEIVGLAWQKATGLLMAIFRHFLDSHGTETERVLGPSCSFDTLSSAYT